MNSNEFKRMLKDNEGKRLRDKSLVRVHRYLYLPHSIETKHETNWKGVARKVTRFLLQEVAVAGDGEIVLKQPTPHLPRQVEWSFKNVGRLVDEEMDKRQIAELSQELLHRSPWSPDPSDYTNSYEYEMRAERALVVALKEAMLNAGVITSDDVGVRVGDQVTVSFTMSLSEAKNLIYQQATA